MTSPARPSFGRLAPRARAFRPRRRVAAVALLALAAAIGVAVVLLQAPSGGAPASASRASVAGAVSVARRDLVATDTESGTVGYADPRTVYDRLTGTITWLPAVGQLIRPGRALFDVNNVPVVLFDGSTPAFRALSASDGSGPDVYELNRDLVRLGFDPDRLITVDDTWQTATTDAVKRWQASLGRTQTGTIPLGDLVFLPGAQRVTTVDAVLGGAGGQGGGGSNSAASFTGTPRTEEVSYVPTASTAATGATGATGAAGTTGATGATGSVPPQHGPSPAQRPRRRGAAGAGNPSGAMARLEAQLRAEEARLRNAGNSPSSGSPGGSSSPPSGSGTGSGDAPAVAVLQTASPRLVVTVDLNSTMQSEASVGAPVSVQLPDGNTVSGRVTAVSPVAQSQSNNANGNANNSDNGGGGSGGSGNNGPPTATIPVTVTLTGHDAAVAGLDQATVSVNFDQQQARNVLSVPVTALLARAGGGYAVQVAAPPRRLIPVTTGLFAAGYVQVSGAGLYDGLQVTDSQG
jgi:hypothetical protein